MKQFGKYKICLLLLMLVEYNVYSQDYFYYKDSKMPMQANTEAFTISINSEFVKSSLDYLENVQSVSYTETVLINNEVLETAKVIFIEKLELSDYNELAQEIKSIAGVVSVSPTFYSNDCNNIFVSNLIYVKLKNEADTGLLESFSDEFHLQILWNNLYMPQWYTLACTENTIHSPVTMANMMYETDQFLYVEPDFIENDLLCEVNDQFYHDQWNLSNTGQYGEANIDINIVEAWLTTEGESDVVIGVLDRGIELNHPDILNVYPLSYNSETGIEESQLYGTHGTNCAGIIGAERNNEIGISGIAPGCRLMSISNTLMGTANSEETKANGINWAWQNGADILSNSWSTSLPSSLIDDAIENALVNGREGLGTVVVFASGNTNNSVRYPGSANEDIIVVGAINPCAKRIKPFQPCGSWNAQSGSCFGEDLDVVAPGIYIPTTDNLGEDGRNPLLENNTDYSDFLDYTSAFGGTSSACPHVAGVAGLLLSVNPCLSHNSVADIIESTCNKVGGYTYLESGDRLNGTWNNELGYGLIDSKSALDRAIDYMSENVDIYIRDSNADFGVEPNNEEIIWASDDIWIRNYDDNGLAHQNPEFKENDDPNYVYVKINNKSCQNSSGEEILSLYWSKSGQSLVWPEFYETIGENIEPGQLGGIIDEGVILPEIAAGQDLIVKIPWVVPNPNNYSSIEGYSGFNIIATINSVDDPLLQPQTSNVLELVRINNNAAMKNVTVVDLINQNALEEKTSLMISNNGEDLLPLSIEFFKDDNVSRDIFVDSELRIHLDDNLLAAWESGGRCSEEAKACCAENQLIIKSDGAKLCNLLLQPEVFGVLDMSFSFLINKNQENINYKYHVIIRNCSNGEVVTGGTFIVGKGSRVMFEAFAGEDIEINRNDPIHLCANDINENAIYNWYKDDCVIYSGPDFVDSPQNSQLYKLEVISLLDGYKDYDEVRVDVKNGFLDYISPNPASTIIEIGFELYNSNNAYLILQGVSNSNVYSYLLNMQNDYLEIDVSDYEPGMYSVLLISNTEVVDSKSFLKN